jgi:acid phosphatase
MRVLGFFICLLSLLNASHACKFLSIGDWGDHVAITESGLSKFFAEEAENAPVGLLVGDNFYDRGVESVDDPQWQKTYLDVFTGKNLEKIRFLVASGNHDYYGNVTAQIEYTRKDPTKRWIFPSFYHARSFEQNGVKLFFVVLDTWRLNGGDAILGHEPSTGRTWIRSRDALQQAVTNQNISPALAERIQSRFKYDPDHSPQFDEEQYRWLRRALTSKSALESDWRIVMGHFPIHSASKYEHGDTHSLVKRLDGELRDLNVDAYLSGHDHILQISHRGGGLHYYGTGAGAKRHPYVNKLYRGLKGAAVGAFGFMKHEATKTTLTTTFVVSIGEGLGGVKKYAYTYSQNKSAEPQREFLRKDADILLANE